MLLNLLKKFSYKEGIIGVLILCLVWIANAWHTASVELEQARLAYQNPKIVTVEKLVYKVGPVRIRTVTTKEKDGDEKTDIEEIRYGESLESDSNTEKAPVSVSEIVRTERTNRWLLGISNRDFTFKRSEYYGGWAGYSFSNRADVLVGLENNKNLETHLLMVWRF